MCLSTDPMRHQTRSLDVAIPFDCALYDTQWQANTTDRWYNVVARQKWVAMTLQVREILSCPLQHKKQMILFVFKLKHTFTNIVPACCRSKPFLTPVNAICPSCIWIYMTRHRIRSMHGWHDTGHIPLVQFVFHDHLKANSVACSLVRKWKVVRTSSPFINLSIMSGCIRYHSSFQAPTLNRHHSSRSGQEQRLVTVYIRSGFISILVWTKWHLLQNKNKMQIPYQTHNWHH